jgi:hypothetical protein
VCDGVSGQIGSSDCGSVVLLISIALFSGSFSSYDQGRRGAVVDRKMGPTTKQQHTTRTNRRVQPAVMNGDFWTGCLAVNPTQASLPIVVP